MTLVDIELFWLPNIVVFSFLGQLLLNLFLRVEPHNLFMFAVLKDFDLE